MSKNAFAAEVGARIRELREERGITAEELARQVDRAYSSFTAWERGNRAPDIESLLRVAEVLDVSTDYLLTGHEPEAVELGKKTGLSQKALEGFVTACGSGKGFFEYAFNDPGAAFIWGDFGCYIERAVAFQSMPKGSRPAVVPPGDLGFFDSDWGLLFESEAKRIVKGLISGYIREEVEKHAQKKDSP